MKTETPFALRMVDIPIIIRTNDGVGDTDRITTIIQNFTNSQEGYKELFAILLKGEHTQKNTNVSLLFKIFFYIVAFIVFFSLNLKVAILFLEASVKNNDIPFSYQLNNNNLSKVSDALIKKYLDAYRELAK